MDRTSLPANLRGLLLIIPECILHLEQQFDEQTLTSDNYVSVPSCEKFHRLMHVIASCCYRHQGRPRVDIFPGQLATLQTDLQMYGLFIS